jgi:hypothetical protein
MSLKPGPHDNLASTELVDFVMVSNTAAWGMVATGDEARSHWRVAMIVQNVERGGRNFYSSDVAIDSLNIVNACSNEWNYAAGCAATYRKCVYDPKRDLR